jgi:hypothetical protein
VLGPDVVVAREALGGEQLVRLKHGKPLTKTAQISLAGNSVCPQVVGANTKAA